MKLFTLPWRNHRRTEWDHSHRQQKYLSAQPERPPEGRRSSPVKSLSQKDTLLFSSPPIAPSTSVARSLSAEKENPHAAWSASKDLVPTAAWALTTKQAHPHPLPPPATTQGEAQLKCEGQQRRWGKMCSISEAALQKFRDKQGSEKTGHSKAAAAISMTTDRSLGGQQGLSSVPRNQDLGALRHPPIWH